MFHFKLSSRCDYESNQSLAMRMMTIFEQHINNIKSRLVILTSLRAFNGASGSLEVDSDNLDRTSSNDYLAPALNLSIGFKIALFQYPPTGLRKIPR